MSTKSTAAATGSKYDQALAAVRAKGAKKPTVAKKMVGPAKNTRQIGKPVARLTSVWSDSKGKDVPMKATVTFDGKQWTVKSRFTSRTKEGVLVPCLALAPKSGKDKKGKHTPAKSVTLAS
jgi:hypothetical protein